ncbi:MAG: hypothetical protein HY788_09025 [Deltaproteobacteria bacterium]|nr:hypothetical protein [Deltaproteobacteria bacterium]
MASNFKILVHRNSDSLHLKLIGDFDGTSAHEVLNALDKNAHGVRKVYIHTSCLKEVSPFGRDVFRSRISAANGGLKNIQFTGEAAEELCP